MNQEEMQQNFVDVFRKIDGVSGFYGLTPYTDGNIGFSIKKDFSPSDADEHTSIISFYVPNKPGELDEKKHIIIDANYGEKRGESISIRATEKTSISAPIDLISADDYYYDFSTKKLFHKTEEISPIALAQKIYSEHIKPTKPVRGLWLRIKLLFWKEILRTAFELLSRFFHYLLLIITGDRYSYVPVLQEEILNNQIIAHRFKEMVGHTKERGRAISQEGAKFNFLGYQASYWTIIFYSILNLALYLYCEAINWKPPIVVTLIKNSFLTLIYVIVSLWFLEAVVPRALKFLIKYSAVFSFRSASKRIRV